MPLVRARDGAFYRDPLWVFPEGFICFSDDEPPELVIWLDPGNPEGPPPVSPVAILERVFGYGITRRPLCAAVVDSLGAGPRTQRTLPGSDPVRWAPAQAYRFKMIARPPRPQLHAGVERYSRSYGGTVMDWPSSALDPLFLEVPE